MTDLDSMKGREGTKGLFQPEKKHPDDLLLTV